MHPWGTDTLSAVMQSDTLGLVHTSIFTASIMHKASIVTPIKAHWTHQYTIAHEIVSISCSQDHFLRHTRQYLTH